MPVIDERQPVDIQLSEDRKTVIGISADLQEIRIPNGVTSIKCTIPENNHAKTIYLPDSIKSVQAFAFYNCTNATIQCSEDIAKKIPNALRGHKVITNNPQEKKEPDTVENGDSNQSPETPEFPEKTQLDKDVMTAAEIVVNNQKASTSLIQRIMRIGYAKASGIMDQLEENKIISPVDEAGSRQVLINNNQLNELFTREAKQPDKSNEPIPDTQTANNENNQNPINAENKEKDDSSNTPSQDNKEQVPTSNEESRQQVDNEKDKTDKIDDENKKEGTPSLQDPPTENTSKQDVASYKTTYVEVMPEKKPGKLTNSHSFKEFMTNLKDAILYTVAKIVNTAITGAAKLMLGKQGYQQEVVRQERERQKQILREAERAEKRDEKAATKEKIKDAPKNDKKEAKAPKPSKKLERFSTNNEKFIKGFSGYLVSSMKKVAPEISAEITTQSLPNERGRQNIMEIRLTNDKSATEDTVSLSPMGNTINNKTENTRFISAAYCAYLAKGDNMSYVKSVIAEDVNNAIGELEKHPNEKLTFQYNDIVTTITPNEAGDYIVTTNLEQGTGAQQKLLSTVCAKDKLADIVTSNMITGIQTRAESFEREIFEIDEPTPEKQNLDYGQPTNYNEDLTIGDNIDQDISELNIGNSSEIDYGIMEDMDTMDNVAFENDI